MLRSTVAAFFLFGLAVCLAHAQTPEGVPPNEPLVLINGNVVNVRNGTIMAGATVVLRNGKIESVGKAAAPAGVRTIDLKGKYVLPGLIDAHAHVETVATARRALESGVTTLRNAGVNAWYDVGLRELVRSGAIMGPEVLAAGYWIRSRLPEGAFLTDPVLAPLMPGIESVEAMRQAVRVTLNHGVDWIKLFATEAGGSGDPRRQVFTEAEIRAAVEEGAAKGVAVQVHAHSDEAAAAAVRAGARSVEHGTYMTEATIALIKDKGIYLVPTHADFERRTEENENVAAKLRYQPMTARLEQTMRRAIKMGVKIVAGTDGAYAANSVVRIPHEIAAFIRMGMTPLQAIQSATLTAAELLRLDKSIGVLEPGFEADLIAVDGDPLENSWVLQDPLLIIANGRVVVNRTDLNRRMTEKQ